MDLVLSTFGTSLSRDNECFIIKNRNGKQRISTNDIHSILIGKGVQITSDAVMLAIEMEIEILFIEKGGNLTGRVWSNKYGSVSTIRKGQLEFINSQHAVELIKNIICEKFENQEALLLMIEPVLSEDSQIIDKTIKSIDSFKEKIKHLEGISVRDIGQQIRGWEGYVSKKYFEAMNLCLPEKFRFGERSQHPALDITNALLNYGYGILYGKIEGMLIKTGIDPYLGILHRDEYNRPVLVYDLIEKYRVWVDYVVYSLLSQDAISNTYYSISSDGSYWLEGLGKKIIIQSMNDYLDEIIIIKGLSRSRETHMFLHIQDLAQVFKNFKVQ